MSKIEAKKIGAANGARTRNLLLHRETLCQLSYGHQLPDFRYLKPDVRNQNYLKSDIWNPKSEYVARVGVEPTSDVFQTPAGTTASPPGEKGLKLPAVRFGRLALGV